MTTGRLDISPHGNILKMKIELTKDQAQALLTILDIAVKAGGLQVASTVVFFHGLLEAAARAESNADSPTVNGQ